MALTPGIRLGPYEIVAPLGAGGMGEVYRASDTRLGREVAVKILPREMAEDAGRRARFEREARAASALSHPGLITIHDVGREGDIPYLVMELVPGRTLRSLLDEGPLPLRRALEVAAQVAAALARAHEAGLVHRDLKPDNIMVGEDGMVKILDFGLAKARPAAAERVSQLATAATAGTTPGMVVGTPGYMSPEQIRGAEVDAPTDQFSLGLVLYEMLAGRGPFQRETPVQTLTAILEDEPEPLSGAGPVPAPVRWLLDRCLAKAPAERYAATADLARDLAALREHLTDLSQAAAPASDSPRRRAGAGLFMLGWLVGLVAAVAVGAALVPAWLGGAGEAPAPAIRSLTFSGFDGQPDASPDGRMLAFSSTREARPRIWLRQIGSGREVPLTGGPDIYPRFSPDGGTVLFVRMDAAGASLHRVATLGGEPRLVVPDGSEGDWFPEGDRIAFLRTARSRGRLVSEVGTVPAAGGSEEILARLEGYALFGPRVSPDGSWIVASASTLGLSEGANKFLYLVPTGGGRPRRLSPALDGGDPSAAAWLPSSRALVYAQGESVTSVSLARSLVNLSASRIVLQDITTGEARELLGVPYLVTVMDLLGPDRLVFDGVGARQSLAEHRLAEGPDGGDPRVLSRGSHIDRQPVYTPDGRAVVFSSNRAGNLDIWRLSLESGELMALTDHPADDWDPAFSADGRWLFWSSHRTGRFEIWMAAADGSNPRQVSADGVDAENPTSTPDGEWVVYNSGHPDRPGLWIVRRDGDEARHLLEGSLAWPELSPDGRFVSFVQNHTAGVGRIGVLRVADGEVLPFQIPIRTSAESLGRARWMPGGEGLAYTGMDSQGRMGVFVQRFDPGAEDTSATRRALVLMPPGVLPETFGISPDGLRVTIAGSERTWSLLQAENLPGLDGEPSGP